MDQRHASRLGDNVETCYPPTWGAAPRMPRFVLTFASWGSVRAAGWLVGSCSAECPYSVAVTDEGTAGLGSPARRKIEIHPETVARASPPLSPRGPATRAVPRRPLPVARLLVAFVVVAALASGALAFAVSRSSLTVEGIAEGQTVTRRDLPALTVRVETSGAGAGDVRVEVNGEQVQPVDDGEGALVVGPQAMTALLSAGDNTLAVSQPGRFGLGGVNVERTFRFDPAAPWFMVPAAVPAPSADRPTVLRGLVDGAAALTANGQAVVIEQGGAFTVRVAPGTTTVALVATDAAGNPAPATVTVTDEPPPAAYLPTAAVHVTAHGWADPAVRNHIIELARAGWIDAVQLDIKDEGGTVGYASAVPLAVASGAAAGVYDAPAALAELHALDVRVIGRIVCFLDPQLARWAWGEGETDMLVLRGAEPLPTDYGDAAFTNVADASVRQYQIDLAVEAAGLGFDEILYDYVRRPEGDLESMTFPGIYGSPTVAVARFVAETASKLEGTGTLLGVSVFGIAATRPDQIAQDIRLLAPHVDYVAPMLYPSHWGPGEFGVADPNRQPGDIVAASLVDFHHAVAGSGAAVVPWLQDFSAGGVTYGPVEVRAQIDAARAAGSPGFLLWNSGSTYTSEALAPPTTTVPPTTPTSASPTTVATPGPPTTAGPPTAAPTTLPPTTAR